MNSSSCCSQMTVSSQIVVRPLTASDSAAYRAVRKKILQIGDGRYFTDYGKEKNFTEEKWRSWCTETQDHCIIGTFIQGELIGIMGIVRYGPPSSLTVEWEATWLDPRYRKFGIAKLAYEMVQKWTRDHGYKYAVVLIRHDNFRSREIREKQGARYICVKRNELWDDGSVADLNFFVIDLFPMKGAQNSPYARALEHMGGILASFKHELPVIIQGQNSPDIYDLPEKRAKIPLYASTLHRP